MPALLEVPGQPLRPRDRDDVGVIGPLGLERRIDADERVAVVEDDRAKWDDAVRIGGIVRCRGQGGAV